jgi:hypothetical protein
LKEKAIELLKSEEEINTMNDDMYVNMNREEYEKFENNSSKSNNCENKIIALRAPSSIHSKAYLINENSNKFSNQTLNNDVLNRIQQAQILNANSSSLNSFYSKYNNISDKLIISQPIYKIFNKSVENSEYFELNNKKFQSDYEKTALKIDNNYIYQNQNIQDITSNIHHLNLNEDALDGEQLKITNKFNKNLLRLIKSLKRNNASKF